jgi:hypothetical protein
MRCCEDQAFKSIAFHGLQEGEKLSIKTGAIIPIFALVDKY